MNAITAIAKPAAPVSRMYASMLTRHDGWTPEPLAVNAKLIPPDACRAIVAEMTAALDGMAATQASAMARKLMGAYPNRSVNDPETFAEFAALAFARCPPDLGVTVIDRLTDRLKFLPTKADIAEEVNAATRDRRTALRVAQMHAEAHERRGGGDTPREGWKDASPEQRAEIETMLRRAKGMPADDAAPAGAGGPDGE